jgi:aspartyl-tRNA(Asn)/glutamyl-tRNA(Gln) amidotransferase subunit C
MGLSREAVRHIALLARLDLSPHEEATFAEQLDHILQHFEKLAALNTDNVEATAQVADTESAYREDVVTNGPAPEALRANAPARDGDFFKVPKIIE